jgi:hypothetical protein
VPPTRGNYGSLIHRYSFNGPSVECVRDNPQWGITPSECAEDSVGNAHGIIHNATLSGGAVAFTAEGWIVGSNQPPEFPQYVELPSGMFSALGNVTLMVWFYWSGDTRGSTHTPRVFNFGSDNGNNGIITAWFLTPSWDASNTPRMGLRTPTHSGFNADVPARPSGTYCYGLVFDESRDRAQVFVGGYSNTINALQGNWLADLDDQKNWLGRSPVAMDTPFVGSIDELRVYNAVLAQSDVENICGNPN